MAGGYPFLTTRSQAVDWLILYFDKNALGDFFQKCRICPFNDGCHGKPKPGGMLKTVKEQEDH